MSAIPVAASPAANQTLNHAAIVTVNLLNQSPGAEPVGGVTLYFEPIGVPKIWLIPVDETRQDYPAAIAQGIQQALEQVDANLTGLRIWLCDQLWHPVDSRPRAFTDAATQATVEVLQWVGVKPFAMGGVNPEAIAEKPPFPNAGFERQDFWARDRTLCAPTNVPRWTVTTPLVSHVTLAKQAFLRKSSHQLTPDGPLMGAGLQTQVTLFLKAIAPTSLVCPSDKLPEFRADNIGIFNAFADAIRTELPNARGFEVLVQQLNHPMTAQNRNIAPSQSAQATRSRCCLSTLKFALQQAVNVAINT